MNLNEVWQKAWKLYQNQEFQPALMLFNQINDVHDDPTVCFVMAQSYWQLGRYKKAIVFFNKSYLLDKNQVQYPLALIKALVAENKKKKAKKSIAEALKIFENEPELLLYQALIEHSHIQKIEIDHLISLFNQQQASQNIINLSVACKMFKVNKHVDINDSVCSGYNYLASYKCFHRIYKISETAELLSFPKDVLKFSLGQAKFKGHIIEAGVYYGQSINLIAKMKPNNTIFGFDSFAGLPEDWSDSEQSGSYSTSGKLPKVRKNVKLIEGWFNETLPKFINENPAPVSFLHVDCDIYSSTKDILNSLVDYIVPGTVILFDDFFGYQGYEQHEWKALDEFVNENKRKIEFIAFCPLGRELAIKVLE